MKIQVLEKLRCPTCGGVFKAYASTEERGEIESGHLECVQCGADYPIRRFIPRFVPEENYATNFGFQWNEFRQTQLDSFSGVDVSRERFLLSTGIAADEISGKYVLDVGCGAGRFAEIALSLGANVVALDYSSAVDACFENLGDNPRLTVVQGDIFHLPVAREQFDFVYCLGVLQHTPDPARAFASLAPVPRAGGKLAVDVYPKLWTNLFWSKYWLRPLTKRLPQKFLFRLVQKMVPILMPVSDMLAKVPGFRKRLRYLVPVVNYRGVISLSERQIREWAVLDTFDMLAPAHDHPQTDTEVRRWFKEAGFSEVHVSRAGHIIGYGTKPALSGVHPQAKS